MRRAGQRRGAWRPPPPEGRRARRSVRAPRGGRRRTPSGGCERVEGLQAADALGRRAGRVRRVAHVLLAEGEERTRHTGTLGSEVPRLPTLAAKERFGGFGCSTTSRTEGTCRPSSGGAAPRCRVDLGRSVVCLPAASPRPTGAQTGGGGANPRRRRRASGGGADPAGAPRRRDDRSFAA